MDRFRRGGPTHRKPESTLPEDKRRIAPVGIILANPQLVLASPKFGRVKMHDQDGGTIAVHDSLSGRSQEGMSLPIR